MSTRSLLLWGGFLMASYASACVVLRFYQNRFIFLPEAAIATTPERFRLRYQDVWLSVVTPEGKVEQMHGWWIPAAGPEVNVLLYLHGNGINIGANAEQASRFQQLGFSVLLIDYRGYGRSEGEFPTEASVYADAATAWDYLTQERGIPPQRIFIYGHSLGGAVGIDLATHHPEAAGLIVQSSFTSMTAMTHRQGWPRLFPIQWLLTQRFDSLSKAPALQLPVLYIHGTEDGITPLVMSQDLYAATPAPKQLAIFTGAGHNNVAAVGGADYLQVIQQFVRQVQQQQLGRPSQIGGVATF